MKQGWEVKKLGEVCEKLTDGSHNPPKGIDHSDFIMLSSQNVFNDCLLYDDVRFLQEEDFNREDKRTCVREGDVILTIVGTIGRCSVLVGDRKVTLQRSVAVLHPLECIIPRFLMYSLIGNKSLLNEHSHGIAQKGIYLKQLSQIPIPVPPLPVQEQIVSELDLLSGIIEKKREQLKELDALAQSIFYDMFGDPITNEKGWEVIPLKQASQLKAGKAIKANELSDISNTGLYPCFGGNGIRGYINKKSHNGQHPIIGRQGALCGNVVMAQGEFYATEHAVVCNDIIDSIKPIWLYFALKHNNLNRFAQGVAQPGLSVNIINEMPLILPPLPLQHQFASNIEAIERQKELIKQSISETETLFNERMQHYFS